MTHMQTLGPRWRAFPPAFTLRRRFTPPIPTAFMFSAVPSVFLLPSITPKSTTSPPIHGTQGLLCPLGDFLRARPTMEPTGRFTLSAASITPALKRIRLGSTDPVADSWDTSRADIPVGMAGAGYSIVGEFIYLAGGWGGGSGSTNHYRYDIVNNTWASMASVPVAIYAPASAAGGMQTYLVGGGHVLLGASNNELTVARHSSLRMPSVSYNSTYIYDTLSNTWTTGPNTNSAHWFSGGTAIGRQLLVVAGESTSGDDTDIVEMATAPRAEPTPRPHPTPAPRP